MNKALKLAPWVLALLLAGCGAESGDTSDTDNGRQDLTGEVSCGVPEICHLCADQRCAVGEAQPVDDQCQVSWSCEDGSEPGSGISEDNANAADDADAIAGDENIVCGIPEICHFCEDLTCAEGTAQVIDGECGPIDWSCADGSIPGSGDPEGTLPQDEAPAGNAEPEPCAVPEICMLCEDETCAQAVFSGEDCNFTWTCADGSTLE